jgi:hypothetical protein
VEEAVSTQSFKEAFPHGVGVVLSEDRPVVDMIFDEVREDEGRVLALCWAYPNKDFVFDVTDPKETDHGWWVTSYEGAKVFLYPLTKDRGDVVAAMLKEY